MRSGSTVIGLRRRWSGLGSNPILDSILKYPSCDGKVMGFALPVSSADKFACYQREWDRLRSAICGSTMPPSSSSLYSQAAQFNAMLSTINSYAQGSPLTALPTSPDGSCGSAPSSNPPASNPPASNPPSSSPPSSNPPPTYSGPPLSSYQSATAEIAALQASMRACTSPSDSPLPPAVGAPGDGASAELATAYEQYLAQRALHAGVAEEALVSCSTGGDAQTPVETVQEPTGDYTYYGPPAGATVIPVTGGPYDPALQQVPQTTDDLPPAPAPRSNAALIGASALAVAALGFWAYKRGRRRAA